MPWITGSRSDGYRVQWRTGGRKSPFASSRTFHNKADAEAELRAMQVQHDDERSLRMAASPSTPLADLFRRWKRSRIAARRAREDYADEAIGHLTTMAKACKWTVLADITAESVDRWRTAKKGTGTDTPLRVLKSVLRWCRRTLRLRVADGVLDVESRRRTKKPAVPLLSDEQVATVLATAYGIGGQPVGVAIEHLVLYGARPIDVCRLTVGDWDAKVRAITYRATKNLDDITHPVHEFHAAKLDGLAAGRKPTDPLFLDPWGRPWKVSRGSAQAISSWYYQNIGEHSLPMGQRGIYMLKRYALTRLAYASGGNRQAMATMSGHRTLLVMDRYLASNVDTQAKMLAAIPEPIGVSTSVSTPGETMQKIEMGRRRNPLKNQSSTTP